MTPPPRNFPKIHPFFPKVRMLRIHNSTNSAQRFAHTHRHLCLKKICSEFFWHQAMLTMYQVCNVKHLPNVVKLISVFAAQLLFINNRGQGNESEANFLSGNTLPLSFSPSLTMGEVALIIESPNLTSQ